MVVLLWAPIGTGAIRLTINEEDVSSIFLAPSDMCTIEVVSDDAASYMAFLDYSFIQGDIWHTETRAEAGELAYVTNWPDDDYFELAAFGFSPHPSAGIHFVFHYHGAFVGEDHILLWDDAFMTVLDMVQVFVAAGDLEPPSPDPMTWASPPMLLDRRRVTMTATTASDPCGVEYHFDCVSGGGDDSGWQEDPNYTDDDLAAGTEYTYRVKARDKSANQNETDWSIAVAVTTPNDIYVDDDAPNDPGPGDPCVSDPCEDGSEAHPFDAIQEGMNASANGDTIFVLDGTYTGDGNRDIDFNGKAVMVRSENGPQNCVIDCNGTFDDCHRGFSFTSGESDSSVVEGFTIINGLAHVDCGDGVGGAIKCVGSSPTITNCIVQDNFAIQGGGIFCELSNPTIISCVIEDNYGTTAGGIFCTQSGPTVIQCRINNNEGAYEGGGIFCWGSSPAVTNSMICDNYTGWAGSWGGGGIACRWNSSPAITNCTIANNTCEGLGGGILSNDGSYPAIKNCIVWTNDVPGISGPAALNYSCAQDWVSGGEGNINADPCFFNPDLQDYHLRTESLCIDAGDPNGNYANQTDIDGEPRVLDLQVDMGSDEVFATSPGLLIWYEFGNPNVPAEAENSGSYGSSHDGNLMPACPNCPAWVAPGYSSAYALEFDGINDYVEIPALNISTSALTISAWINGDGAQGSYTGIVSSRDQVTGDATGLGYGSAGPYSGWQANQELCYYWNEAYWLWHSGLFIPSDEWTFVAVAVEPTQATLYLDDGTFYAEAHSASHGPLEQFDSGSLSQIAGDDMHEYFDGLIDDIRIYNRGLSTEEIASIAGADLTRAWDPIPTGGATGVVLDTVLSWRPGSSAAETNGHDVYFGATPWSVVGRDPNVNQGRQAANSFDPAGDLEFGRTYFWAIDEVNSTHPNTPWPGPVWSFTTGNVIYVDANAAGADNGSSWTDAFIDLQDGLDTAQEGDQIWVAEGTYRPSQRTQPVNPRTETFQLVNGVAVYGGFPAGGGNWDGRDPNAYETILSGDLDGNDVTVADVCDLPNEPTRAENAYHVVTGSGTGTATILDGFTITGGNANGLLGNYIGAGMTCAVLAVQGFTSGGSPTVSNCTFTEGSASHDGGGLSYSGGSVTSCTFTGNFAGDDGGAMHFCSGPVADCNITGNEAYDSGGGVYKCSGSLSDSVITGNSAGGWGGGIYNSDEGGYSSITGCAISENSATYGGGVYNDACSPTFTNCTLTANDAAEGGGLLNYANVAAITTKCTFYGNTAGTGGAIFNEDTEALLFTNCTFSGNLAESSGGAIYNLASSLALTNCALSGNAADDGGAMFNLSSTATVTNCTFSGNDAGADGGGVYSDPNTVPVIDDSVFWGNTDTGDGTEAAQISGPASINYSCVEGWTGLLGGTGNIGDDPNFVRDPNDGGDGWDGGNNDDYGDLRLTAGSSCIDAADNNSVPPDTADVDGDGNTVEPTSRDLIGHLRFIDDPNTVDTGSGTSPIVDMGAYEFILEIYVDDDAVADIGPGDPDISDPNEDGSSGHPFDSIQEAIDVSVDGDTIVVLPGTYIGTGNRDIDFGAKAITLRSTYPDRPAVVEATLIDCEASSEDPHRGFYFHSGEDGNSVLRGFTITNGYYQRGGGIYCDHSSPAIVTCTLIDNAAVDGGGMLNFNSSVTLAGCTFVGNSASAGAGLFNQGQASAPALTSCIFSANMAENSGGGMFNYKCSTLVDNCTFSVNTAGNNGGAMYNYQSNPVVTNCILWANADGGAAGQAAQFGGSGSMPVINYCCVQGWTGSLGGAGNMGTDPLLTPDDHLRPGSACINGGDPNGDYTGQSDIDGEDRVSDGRVDVGADEFADGDGDGLSDSWERRYFGDTSADPNDDPDGDGLTNIEEYGLYGSNPNTPPIRVPQDFVTIQQAIDGGGQGDTVLVAAGVYSGPGNIDLDFGGKGLVLYGPNGPGLTIIDCCDAGRGFDFHSGETAATAVVGFTVMNGLADYGGAVRCDHSHPQIRDCVFTGDTATTQGHTIHCVMSTPTLADCDISSGVGPSIADIWMQYGGAQVLGLVRIFDCSWVGTNLTITGDGTVLMGSGAELNLDESLIFCDFVGPVNVQVSTGSELTIDGDADIDLSDPCDPNVRGTIDCNGLLLVKDNVQISNANINVTRARFEDQTSIVNNVITIARWAPPGQFVIERDVDVLYNDFHVNGDRYMDLTPRMYQGQFEHCRIFVTITEGIGQDQGGLFECRGDPCFAEPNFADPCCDPNGFVCRVLPGTIPDCNIRTWTVERMEFVPHAKLNLTNRFPFKAPWISGGDDDVLYVKELVLGDYSVLNTAYNWLYYGSLQRAPTAVITDVPLLGFSLICITFDDNLEYIVRVTHNNYKHPVEPSYDRNHVTRVEGNEPDPNGMMQMRTIEDVDPNSPTDGQVISARAKGTFAKANEDHVGQRHIRQSERGSCFDYL
jgi:hypothetical protein